MSPIPAAIEGLSLDLRDPDHLRQRRRDRMRLAVVLGLSLLLHAAPLLLMEPEVKTDAPVEEAIPVEIIVEPPPPEPQPEAKLEEPPKQDQAQPTLAEKPATDFARATDQDKEEGKSAEVPDEQKQKIDKPPEQAQESPEKPKSEAEQEPEPEAGEPLTPAEAPDPPAVEPEPPKPVAPDYQSQAFMPPLPDYQFEAPAKRTQDPRGSGDPGYLSTLYGRIMKRMHAPPAPAGSRNFRGRIVFSVMRNGALGQASVVVPSGLHALDTAALTAIRRAAPFPPPPVGAIQIQFDYGTR